MLTQPQSTELAISDNFTLCPDKSNPLDIVQ